MATAEVARAASAIRALQAGRHLLLLLDFDGTLCEFDPDPDAVELPEARRALLVALAARHDVTLGVASGRRLLDVRRRTQLGPRAYYSGLHGLEIEGPGVSFIHPEADRALDAIRQVSAALVSEFSGMPGVFVEDKTLSVVAHFRDAGPGDAERIPAVVECCASPFLEAGLLKRMNGSCMLELLPNIDWNKGSAVAWIRELTAAAHPDAVCVYVGDDVTDEDAFRAVRGHGIAVAASPRARGADHQVDGPRALEEMLRQIA